MALTNEQRVKKDELISKGWQYLDTMSAVDAAKAAGKTVQLDPDAASYFILPSAQTPPANPVTPPTTQPPTAAPVTPTTQPTTPPPVQSQPRQATFINADGKKIVVNVDDKERQNALNNMGYTLMGEGNKPVGELPAVKSTKDQGRFTPEGIDQQTGKKAGAGIQALVESGRNFSETDAQNYAFSIGDQNWQQYVGGVGGQKNPQYIGPTAFGILQKNYTPYQIQQATERTNFGSIQWKAGVNINDIPKEPLSDTVNKETDILSRILKGGKGDADLTSKDTGNGMGKSLLGIDTGESSLDIYNEVYNTPEMNDARKEVNDLKANLDKFDQQLEELRGDIRKEVEGEAPDSYITAMTTIRGEDILKQRRSAQRDYDTAVSNYNGLKENAGIVMELQIKDQDTRYNRAFSEIQFIAQQENADFDKDMAMAEIALRVPEGRTITLPNGSVVKGLAEDDNINAVEFTDENRNTYIVGIDKNTGKEIYRELLGKAPAPQGATLAPDRTPITTALQESQSQRSLDFMAQLDSGNIGTATDDKGKAFYYDKAAYDQAVKDENAADQWWNPLTWGGVPKQSDFIISYQ